MKVVIYGLTITSSWGNGHATTYRSLCKALARRGHTVHFIEKDVDWYRDHRDLPCPAFCSVRLYEHWRESAASLLEISKDADVIVVGSYFPDAIEATYALLHAGYGPVLFYDIDTPVTLAQLRTHGRTEYLEASLIPHYQAYLSFSGGPSLRVLEKEFGSPHAVGFYCSVDPDVYRPVPASEKYRCDLSYLGTFAADRQVKLMQYLNRAAGLLPGARFIVAGPQYPKDTRWAGNVRHIDHVAPPEHPAFYCSGRFTLNLTRDDMVTAGYSPSVRLFEASACGAAIVSDPWNGMDDFLSPGTEILLPRDEYEVVEILRHMPEHEARRIGNAARARILEQHTADHRAMQFEEVVEQCTAIAVPQRAALS